MKREGPEKNCSSTSACLNDLHTLAFNSDNDHFEFIFEVRHFEAHDDHVDDDS